MPAAPVSPARLRERFTGLGYLAGWSAVRHAPQALGQRAFRFAADIAAVRNGNGVRQLRRNLRRAVGATVAEQELDELVRRALRSYARYWFETFRLPRMDKVSIAARAGAGTTGVDHLDAAVDAGRGFILALPHIGNWDVAGIWLIERYGQRFTTVAERLQPDSLFERFVAYRQGLGFEVLPLTGNPKRVSAVLAERLRAGGGICLLADRDVAGDGVEVRLFGEPARLPAGPALLAATTGAPLLPVSMWFTEHGWGQRINPPIELESNLRLRERVSAATQQLADVFAADIATHLTDWHMLQPVWLADIGR